MQPNRRLLLAIVLAVGGVLCFAADFVLWWVRVLVGSMLLFEAWTQWDMRRGQLRRKRDHEAAVARVREYQLARIGLKERQARASVNEWDLWLALLTQPAQSPVEGDDAEDDRGEREPNS